MEKLSEGKSRGLRFAEQQLLRHGWEHGKGLGREENGIAEAIKVKVKCDKGGVGHRQGEQFTFHWWDHVFNKASASLAVESSEDGVKVKKVAGEEEEEEEEEGTAGMISNKKPRKAELTKAKLYGHFVKSATLLSGQEEPEKKDSSTDDSSESDDEDKELDFTTKLSDEDLMKACGGRTAHKGARHGLTMSAKLARLEQQEQEFLAKYGKKTQPVDSICKATATFSGVSILQGEEDHNNERGGKKAKKKKKQKEEENQEDLMMDCGNSGEVSETTPEVVVPKTKKKHSKQKSGSSATEVRTPTEADCAPPKKKKRSKKEKMLTDDLENCSAVSGTSDGASGEAYPSIQGDTDTVTEVNSKDSVRKNRKASKCKKETLGGSSERCCDAAGAQDLNCEPPPTKKMRCNGVEVLKLGEREEELAGKQTKIKRNRHSENIAAESELQDETITVVKKKKKKRKSQEAAITNGTDSYS